MGAEGDSARCAHAVVSMIEDAVVGMLEGCRAGGLGKRGGDGGGGDMLQVACGAAQVLQGLVDGGVTGARERGVGGLGEETGVGLWPGLEGVDKLVSLLPLLCSREAAGKIEAHWMGAGWVGWGDSAGHGGERVSDGGASESRRLWLCQVLASLLPLSSFSPPPPPPLPSLLSSPFPNNIDHKI